MMGCFGRLWAWRIECYRLGAKLSWAAFSLLNIYCLPRVLPNYPCDLGKSFWDGQTFQPKDPGTASDSTLAYSTGSLLHCSHRPDASTNVSEKCLDLGLPSFCYYKTSMKPLPCRDMISGWRPEAAFLGPVPLNLTTESTLSSSLWGDSCLCHSACYPRRPRGWGIDKLSSWFLALRPLKLLTSSQNLPGECAICLVGDTKS